MENKLKIIIAVTGASGSIYARLLLEQLLQSEQVSELALIFSDNGRAVSDFEKWKHEDLPADPRTKIYDNNDMFSPIASGSAGYHAMVIIPCSMGSVGRIASGTSGDLIARAADVMLKERRRLIMVVREAPYSTIHLRNLTALSECGTVILPASPSFYSHPQTLEELCLTVVERVVSLLRIEMPHYQWGKDKIEI